MEQNAFTAGVEPGGLWNKNDIRILLCFVLAGVDAPLSRTDLIEAVQSRGLANYFETEDALDSLIRQGNIAQDGEGLCRVTDTGREIAENWDASLPLSVRDKAMAAALRLLGEARNRKENRVEIEETERGCKVTCHISGGAVELMAVSLYVPDRRQAQLVESRFYRDPEGVYRLLLSALTGDVAYAKAYLEQYEN